MRELASDTSRNSGRLKGSCQSSNSDRYLLSAIGWNGEPREVGLVFSFFVLFAAGGCGIARELTSLSRKLRAFCFEQAANQREKQESCRRRRTSILPAPGQRSSSFLVPGVEDLFGAFAPQPSSFTHKNLASRRGRKPVERSRRSFAFLFDRNHTN